MRHITNLRDVRILVFACGRWNRAGEGGGGGLAVGRNVLYESRENVLAKVRVQLDKRNPRRASTLQRTAGEQLCTPQQRPAAACATHCLDARRPFCSLTCDKNIGHRHAFCFFHGTYIIYATGMVHSLV